MLFRSSYPDSLLARTRLDATTLRRSEDAFVDELFAGAIDMGAPLLAAQFPRAFLDVNRGPAELDVGMFDSALGVPVDAPSARVTAGLGVIPRIVRDGAEIYRGKLKSGEADARLIIGPQFESIVRGKTPKELTAPDQTTREGGLEALDMQLAFNTTAPDPMMEGLTKTLIKLSLQNALLPVIAQKVPAFRGAARASVIPPAWENQQVAESGVEETSNRVYEFFIPSYTVLFVFFLVNIMGRSFINERETGTLRRLRVAPIRPTAILIGKTLPFLVLSLVQTCILMISGRLLFGMSWGSQPWLLLPIMLCTSAAATALGLLFSTVARTESQVKIGRAHV